MRNCGTRRRPGGVGALTLVRTTGAQTRRTVLVRRQSSAGIRSADSQMRSLREPAISQHYARFVVVSGVWQSSS